MSPLGYGVIAVTLFTVLMVSTALVADHYIQQRKLLERQNRRTSK